jgi:UTP--glucose-1-phosphate uridylyltransferase
MKPAIPKEIEKQLKNNNVDTSLTLSILENYNNGLYDHIKPVRVTSIPGIDGKTIIDTTEEGLALPLEKERLPSHIQDLLQEPPLKHLLKGSSPIPGRKELALIGTALYQRCAFGVLNGGSATSYIDEGKNIGFDKELFELYKEPFYRIAAMAEGKAKGLTPAFTNPDGSAGPSFMELKMRSLLLGIHACRKVTGRTEVPPLPLFQMTSVSNNDQIAAAYEKYRFSPFLSELIRSTGIDITRASTGIQPLIAAYTHSSLGKPKKLFTHAYGEKNRILPLPGGHGQNFIALKPVYQALLDQGYRYAWLGNVDNLGTTPDPVLLGYFALTGKQAAFEFSFKTAVDSKGGILVEDQHKRLNCADIGAAISAEEVSEAEKKGTSILFNCAGGIFDLKKLCESIDRIIKDLPTRFSDQNKDAGLYSQAEQVTWEIIGMLDDFLIFGVHKYERFLAAKLLTESLLTSGTGLESPLFPDRKAGSTTLRSLGTSLHRGLEERLRKDYGLKEESGQWVPKSVEELDKKGV